MTPDQASDLAISGLQFLASDIEELSRFVSLTGIAPDEFRVLASTPEFMVAVLDYLLGNEATLLTFATHADIRPETIKSARFALSPPGSFEG